MLIRVRHSLAFYLIAPLVLSFIKCYSHCATCSVICNVLLSLLHFYCRLNVLLSLLPCIVVCKMLLSICLSELKHLFVYAYLIVRRLFQLKTAMRPCFSCRIWLNCQKPKLKNVSCLLNMCSFGRTAASFCLYCLLVMMTLIDLVWCNFWV